MEHESNKPLREIVLREVANEASTERASMHDLTQRLTETARRDTEEVVATLWDLIGERKITYYSDGSIKFVEDAVTPPALANQDRNRIFYSTAFRRLAGVTQVLTPNPEGLLMHNRLTHSLKVSQVARRIGARLKSSKPYRKGAERLGQLSVDVVEAAGLAHDLGHPPFGHIGEEVIDEFARKEMHLRDGFEGNAQTFRIITRLEQNRAESAGMGLTIDTQAAVLKYPWFRGEEPACNHEPSLKWRKFGAYDDDKEKFLEARAHAPNGEDVQSLEAAVMDIADDISYALHDLEDYFEAGILDVAKAKQSLQRWMKTYRDGEPVTGSENPFEELRVKLSREYPALYDKDVYDQAVTQVFGAHLSPFVSDDVGSNRALKIRRLLISELIEFYTDGVHLNKESPTLERPPALLKSCHWHQIQILKRITRCFVIERPDVTVVQRGQQVLLRELLFSLQKWLEEDKKRLPKALQENIEQNQERALIDYVSGLADHQAIALHRRLTGADCSSFGASFIA